MFFSRHLSVPAQSPPLPVSFVAHRPEEGEANAWSAGIKHAYVQLTSPSSPGAMAERLF
jgi:hypothetical protein